MRMLYTHGYLNEYGYTSDYKADKLEFPTESNVCQNEQFENIQKSWPLLEKTKYPSVSEAALALHTIFSESDDNDMSSSFIIQKDEDRDLRTCKRVMQRLKKIFKISSDYYNGPKHAESSEYEHDVVIAIGSVIFNRYYSPPGGIYVSTYMTFIEPYILDKRTEWENTNKLLKICGASQLFGDSDYPSNFVYEGSTQREPRYIMVQDQLGLRTKVVESSSLSKDHHHMEIQVIYLPCNRLEDVLVL